MPSQNSTHLKIKPQFAIVAHSPNLVELRFGVWNPISHILTDEENKNTLFPLISALDGSLSVKEISQKLKIPKAEIETLIDHLENIGVMQNSASNAIDWYLEQVSPQLFTGDNGPQSISAKWPILILGNADLISHTFPLLNRTLGHEFVKIVDPNDPRVRLLENESSEWLHNGMELEKTLDIFQDWKGHLVVCLQSTINPTFCIKLNRVLFNLKTPWIHAALDGPFIFIGPTFSDTNPCYECFETRISMNIKDNTNYRKYKNALTNAQVIQQKDMPLTPILLNLLASHVAMEIINFSLTSSAFTQGKVLTFYLPTMEISFSEFLRYPNCKTCGSAHLRDGKTLYFDINNLLENNV